MRFVDEAKIKIKAGDGGSGMVAWRREKFVPKGGPSGGDGGRGGDIILVAKEGLSSLLDLKKQSMLRSENGENGQSKNKTGRNAREKIVFVPVGTNVKSARLNIDLLRDGQKLLICKGGKGGFGNSHFKGPNCQAPDKAQIGLKGEEKEIFLTLKLMADVGFLGLPNAGKSTLLSRLSNAKPKIADYPFTTLKPMLGVCDMDLGQSMVIADIPGLIEGASLGLGLGSRFLRHLERVRVLCHMIDGSDNASLIHRYEIINSELKNYGEKLQTLPQVVVINKIDAISHNENIDEFINYLNDKKIKVFKVSAVSGEGLETLKKELFKLVMNGFSEEDLAVKNASPFDPLKNLY